MKTKTMWLMMKKLKIVLFRLVMVPKMWSDQLGLQLNMNFFHRFLSDPSPIIALPCQSLHWVIQFLLFFRLDWCDPGIWGFMQPLLVLPAVVIFDSHIVEVGRNQKPCCWCKNKTKAMSLMQEQNKSHIVDVRRKPKPRWILFKLVFSKLLHGFL